MDINQRIKSFLQLKERLGSFDRKQLHAIFDKAKAINPWFTAGNIDLAMDGLNRYLEEEKMYKWTDRYEFDDTTPRTIGVIMPGNIPMAGLHDFISVLISGHCLQAKLSSKDNILLPFVASQLTDIEPRFSERINFCDILKNYDAVIATGSDNSSRYFEYYFSRVPHIIRKNRTSLAVLGGEESPQELKGLGCDIFEYFGLGCRNISKILIPDTFDIRGLIPHFDDYAHISDHNKYANNYHYHRAIMLMNSTAHIDTGFALFTESDLLVSPLSVIYYEQYHTEKQARDYVHQNRNKLQCIVADTDFIKGTTPFGEAQQPEIWDYADDVDTMDFLTRL